MWAYKTRAKFTYARMVDSESDNNGELYCLTQSVIQQVDLSLSYGSDDDIFNDPLSPSIKDAISNYTTLEDNQHQGSLNESDLQLAALDISGLQSGNAGHLPVGCNWSNQIDFRLLGHHTTDMLDFLDKEVIETLNVADRKRIAVRNVRSKENVSCDNSNSNQFLVCQTDQCASAHVSQRKSLQFVVKNDAPSSKCEHSTPRIANERNSCSPSDLSNFAGKEKTVKRLSERIKRTLHANAKQDTPSAVKLKRTKVQPMNGLQLDSGVDTVPGLELCVGDQSKCDSSFFGLPVKVKHLLETQRSITSLYQWQEECLSLPAVREGRNLIYSLPTSGGKTLVAELLMFRQLLCSHRDAILVLPFVALVQEKVRGLSQFAVELDFIVEEYAASKGQIPPRQHRKRQSLYIATIEKANSLVNSLIENGRIDRIGLVVVDELHMLGEGGSRGAVLEMMLTKLMHSSPGTQIVGMSATLNNIADLQSFLSAEIYTNDFRPVELHEFVKIEDAVYAVNTSALCDEDSLKFSRPVSFKYSKEQSFMDADRLAGFVMEVVPQNSCLVFCPTKKNCENVASLICKFMTNEHLAVKAAERKELLLTLRQDGAGELCPVLRQTIPYGIAYHHSGLTMDERKFIEEAYIDGTLCALACTSTLAAGVNLPAKRVILRSPYVGQSFISRSQYKQMIGRAGRAGLDAVGESILIIDKRDRLRLKDLIRGQYDSCRSSLLYEDGKGLRSLLLSSIGLKLTPTEASLLSFIQRTLCALQCNAAVNNVDVKSTATTALERLIELGLVCRKRPTLESTDADKSSDSADFRLEVTNLGRAVYRGSVDISWGKRLYDDLVQAQQSLVVANHLHLLYLSTPYDVVETVQPDWMLYLQQLSNLSSSELQVANIVGVTEGYVAKMAAGRMPRTSVDKFVVKRFYLTLLLHGLWQQKSIWRMAADFRQPRGFVQQLLTGAASFAACVSHFCQELEEFWAYQDLMINYVKKLSYCCTMELIPLVEIPGVKLGRARQLFKAGLTSLQHVAHVDPEYLVHCIEHMPRRVAKQIVASAKMLLMEKTEALREEAESLLAAPASIVASTNDTNHTTS